MIKIHIFYCQLSLESFDFILFASGKLHCVYTEEKEVFNNFDIKMQKFYYGYCQICRGYIKS